MPPTLWGVHGVFTGSPMRDPRIGVGWTVARAEMRGRWTSIRETMWIPIRARPCGVSASPLAFWVLKVYLGLQIGCWRCLEHYFRIQNRVLKASLGSVWGPKWGLKSILALKTDLWCVSLVRATRFWTLLEAPRRPKSIKNGVQKMLRMKKVKILIFDTPPLQNHCFWLPMGAKRSPNEG